jgi:hypothetical protein
MTRKTVENIDQQAREIRERSMSLAAETLSNTFDFAHNIVRAREPQELLQLLAAFRNDRECHRCRPYA